MYILHTKNHTLLIVSYYNQVGKRKKATLNVVHLHLGNTRNIHTHTHIQTFAYICSNSSERAQLMKNSKRNIYISTNKTIPF